MVQINVGSGSRPMPFDRNGVSRGSQADVSMGAAARAITVDWTRTVPAGKRMFVELIECTIRNDSATATNATAASAVRLKDTSGVNFIAFEARLPIGAATLFLPRELGGAAYLYAGETIDGIAFSDNTAAGSSIRTTSGYKATEFDA